MRVATGALWRRLAQIGAAAWLVGLALVWLWMVMTLPAAADGSRPGGLDFVLLLAQLSGNLVLFALVVQTIPAFLFAVVAAGCELRMGSVHVLALQAAAPVIALAASAVYLLTGIGPGGPSAPDAVMQPLDWPKFTQFWMWQSAVAAALGPYLRRSGPKLHPARRPPPEHARMRP
jgi:hypothetical protein